MTHVHLADLEKPLPCLSRASVRPGELESRDRKVAYHRRCGRSAESLWGRGQNGHLPAQNFDDFKESFLETPIQ